MNMNSYITTIMHKKPAQNELLGLLRLVAEPTRLQILNVLDEHGAHCVSDCQCHVPDVSQSLLSHHIADLREAGLIEAEKQGLKVYYSLTKRGQDVMAVLNTLKEEYPMNGCTCTNCTCANCSC
jgi:DNA-binding transcriptional ArsR family regulator